MSNQDPASLSVPRVRSAGSWSAGSFLSSSSTPATASTVQQTAGRLLVATSLLTATPSNSRLHHGAVAGDGPVRLAVINGDPQPAVAWRACYEGELPTDGKLQSLIGQGQLVITITPEQGERYQGIIALEADTLATCLGSTSLQIRAARQQALDPNWPPSGRAPRRRHPATELPAPRARITAPTSEHLEQLNSTIKGGAVRSGSGRDPYRLYHQDKVRVFDPQAIEFRCTCSRARCEGALLQIEKGGGRPWCELGKIDMHCDYCGAHYEFDGIDIETLLQGSR